MKTDQTQGTGYRPAAFFGLTAKQMVARPTTTFFGLTAKQYNERKASTAKLTR